MNTESARLLEPHERQQAARVMARAFWQDPFFEYAFAGSARRQAGLTWLFERMIAYCSRYGAVDTIGDVLGAAIWLPPEHPEFTWYGVMQSGLIAAPLVVGIRVQLRMLELSRHSDELRRAVGGSRWHLLSLGVAPECQGRGLGAALLEPGLERASLAGVGCYLDTTNPSNLAFYQRHGFQLTQSLAARPPRPGVWALSRDPGA